MWDWLKKLTGDSSAGPVATAVKQPGPPTDTPSLPPQDVVIGLDFGTSSTKAVLQTPFFFGGQATPVDFGTVGHRNAPWLLSSKLFVGSDGTCSLMPFEAAEPFVHLKVNLLRPPHGDSDPQRGPDHEARAAAHLGLALRHARSFFARSKPEFLKRFTPRWHVNLGIPSAGFDDDWVRSRFERVGMAAWVLSRGTSPISMTAARQALARPNPSPDLTFAVIPEIAAEVTSYVRSPQRQDGLHVIVDMGASTLDICALNLYEANDIIAMLTAQVERHGLLFLHRARVAAAKGDPPFQGDPPDLLGAMPEPPPHMGPVLATCDSQYVAAGKGMLLRTIVDLKTVRAPLAEAWRTGLPVFVTGGGAASELVHRMVSGAKEYGDRHFAWRGLHPRALPCPPGFPSEFFPRLAVAHGLSYPAINMGTIEPPRAIANIDGPLPSQWREQFIGPEQV